MAAAKRRRAGAGRLPYTWTPGGHRRYPADALRQLVNELHNGKAGGR